MVLNVEIRRNFLIKAAMPAENARGSELANGSFKLQTHNGQRMYLE